MPFFSSSAFSGYGDDDKGFYAVYRRVFERIVELEEQFPPTDEDSYDNADAPPFGSAKTEEEHVKHFYAYWSNFVTHNSFAFLEKWRLSEVCGCCSGNNRDTLAGTQQTVQATDGAGQQKAAIGRAQGV